MEKKLKFLDCTLRDGGYYNRWDFSQDLINSYLKTMSLIGVDIVEIGFRGSIKNSYLGPLAYSSDEFLKQLKIEKSLKISVMVNASNILTGNIKKNISKIFNNKKNSPVSIVRLACHYNDIKKIDAACNILGKLGYEVIVNLMQISERTKEEIKYTAKKLQKNKFVKCMYFADSLGSMNSDDIIEKIKTIKQDFHKDVGIHTHDNLGKALTNTISAVSSGVNWIDSTVYGMGRGPGNLKTEIGLIEIAKSEKYLKNIDSMMHLITKYFLPLHNKYNWGTNPFYYLAGKYKIHPTYIQTMLSDKVFDFSVIRKIIESLQKVDSSSFNPKKLNFANSSKTKKINWNPEKIFKNKEVLILGNGKTAIDHKKELELFVKKNNPIVLALNLKKNISENLIDFRVASHPFRILSELDQLSKIKKKIIMPHSQLPDLIKKKINKDKVLDFGLRLERNKFRFYKNYCSVPNNLVFSYILGIVNAGKADKIFLAGFDGYDKQDTRYLELSNFLNIYANNKKSIPLISFTPTVLKISSRSIFSII